MGPAMSQSRDPNFEEVKRVLRRLQEIGQLDLADTHLGKEPQPRRVQRSAPHSPPPNLLGGHAPMLTPLAGGPDLLDAAGDQPVGRGPRLRTVFWATLVGASAAGLVLSLSVASIKREFAGSRLPKPPASVVMALGPASQSRPGLSDENRSNAASDKLTSAPRVVAPTEWSAPAGAATKLPLGVEPHDEGRNYQALVSGLEATAFVVKGTEIIAGTWIIPAIELANAMVVRNANAPGRTIVTVELRTESGEVVSQAKVVLLAQPLTLETGAATNR
jgi:hypothetical protein